MVLGEQLNCSPNMSPKSEVETQTQNQRGRKEVRKDEGLEEAQGSCACLCRAGDGDGVRGALCSQHRRSQAPLLRLVHVLHYQSTLLLLV